MGIRLVGSATGSATGSGHEPAPPRRSALGWLLRWQQASQEGSLRNAMVATTALVEQRRQRDEVEEFLTWDLERRTAMAGHALARTGTRG